MGVIFKNNVMYGAGDIEISPVCYSEEEREVGVWTDGRPIYQKTYVLQSSVDTTANTWSTISGMSLSGAEDIIIKTEVYLAADKSANTGFGKVDNGVFKYYDTIRLLIDAVTIQYTKTTDTPGSGTWTPSGVPAVHYSTDEHVVGTWIDGSTLYEKVIDFGSLPNNTEKSVAHGISNANKIWIADGYVTTGSAFYELDHSNNTFANNWSSHVDTTNVTIETYTNRSALSAIVILRYTKTTS